MNYKFPKKTVLQGKFPHPDKDYINFASELKCLFKRVSASLQTLIIPGLTFDALQNN